MRRVHLFNTQKFIGNSIDSRIEIGFLRSSSPSCLSLVGLLLFGACTGIEAFSIIRTPSCCRKSGSKRSTFATFVASENGCRHRVPYVCEYYEVLHVRHFHPTGCYYVQEAVKVIRFHQARLRERFTRNGVHPEVCLR